MFLIDDGDFLDRELRRDFRALLRHHHHLFASHSPLKRLAVLRFQSEAHSWLDFDGKVEGIDSRDNTRVVLSEPETVAPEIGGSPVLSLVAQGLSPPSA